MVQRVYCNVTANYVKKNRNTIKCTDRCETVKETKIEFSPRKGFMFPKLFTTDFVQCYGGTRYSLYRFSK